MQPADAKFSSEAQSWRRRAAGAGGVAAARTRSAQGRLWGGGTGPRGDRRREPLFGFRLDRGAARSAPGSALSAGPRDRVFMSESGVKLAQVCLDPVPLVLPLYHGALQTCSNYLIFLVLNFSPFG